MLTLKYVQKRNSTSKSTLQDHFRETRSQVPNANMALCIASIQFYWLKINQNDVYYDHKYFTIKLAENQIFSGILVSVALAFTGFDHPPPHPFPPTPSPKIDSLLTALKMLCIFSNTMLNVYHALAGPSPKENIYYLIFAN